MAEANRTDLMDPARRPGELGAQAQGQKAQRQRQEAAGRRLPQPGERGPAVRPSERPGEPVTAGLSGGPGPGPVSGTLAPLDRVRAAYRRMPSEPLRRMLEVMEWAESRDLRR